MVYVCAGATGGGSPPQILRGPPARVRMTLGAGGFGWRGRYLWARADLRWLRGDVRPYGAGMGFRVRGNDGGTSSLAAWLRCVESYAGQGFIGQSVADGLSDRETAGQRSASCRRLSFSCNGGEDSVPNSCTVVGFQRAEHGGPYVYAKVLEILGPVDEGMRRRVPEGVTKHRLDDIPSVHEVVELCG